MKVALLHTNHQAPWRRGCVVRGEGEDAQLVVIGRSINIHKYLRCFRKPGWENMRYEEAIQGDNDQAEITEGIAAAALHFKRRSAIFPV